MDVIIVDVDSSRALHGSLISIGLALAWELN
jgi:hypothetical protein